MDDITAVAPDGTRLAATVHDAPWSAPLALMIPGLGASRRVYAPFVPFLAGFLRVAVFDPRGVGGSDRPPGPYSMAQLAGDAVAVLDAVGEPAATIWGASMGGAVAQRLALDHPARADRLVLACTWPGSSHGVRRSAEVSALLHGRGATTPEEAYRRACTVLYAESFQRESPDFIEAQIADRRAHPIPARSFDAQLAADRGHETWDELPRISAATLVLHGTADAVVPVENGRLLAGRIPRARGVWLEGRGHLFFHEAPAEAAAALAEFLSA